MRLKELRGLPVIDPTAARKIGTVLDYQVDPATWRLAALDINGVENGPAQRILSERIRRVGGSAVILTERGGATPGVPVEINERWLDGSTLVGLEVMGDDGNRIGRVVDATFDQDSLAIDVYLLRASFIERLTGQRDRIQPSKIHSCSRELMIFSTGRVKELPQPSAVEEATANSLSRPTKKEDRLPAPSLEKAPDERPVGARGA
jgi:sporulation protein YlmC with PRC-barrel domain